MIFFFLLATSSAQTCPSITCGDLIYPDCSKSNLTHYSVSSCLPNEVCSKGRPEKKQICEPSPGTRYSGDYCSSDSECLSNNCISNQCYSNNYLESCSETLDCNVGLYCDGSVCQYQVNENSNCTNDYECRNDLMCNLGLCIPYWSKVQNELVEAPFNSLSFACKYGGAAQNLSGFWHCGLPDNSSTLGAPCNPDDICSSFKGLYSFSCTCGSTSTGTGFCGLFPGDDIVQKAILDSQNVFKVNKFCNTHSRFSLNCFLAHDDQLDMFLEFADNFLQSFGGFYPKIQQASLCAIQTLNREYYEILQAKEGRISSCPAYYCLQDPIGEDQCSIHVKDSNFGQLVDIFYSYPSCEWNYLCNSTGQCEPNNVQPGHPGDYCNETLPCASGHCVEHFCLGIRDGEKCENPWDCMPGFYCSQNSSICERLKLKSEYCEFTYECSNYLICNLNTCINYFSLQLNEITDICDLDEHGTCLYSFACSSGFAYNKAGQYICATAPTSQLKNPCLRAGDICMDKSNRYPHVCTCSIQEVFNGVESVVYCPPFAGDINFLNAMINLKQLLNWNQVCNARSRLSYRCFLRNDEYLGIYYYYVTNLTLFRNYTKLYSVKNCIKKNFMHQEYLNEQYLKDWIKQQEKKSQNDDDSFSNWLIPSLFSVFLVLVS